MGELLLARAMRLVVLLAAAGVVESTHDGANWAEYWSEHINHVELIDVNVAQFGLQFGSSVAGAGRRSPRSRRRGRSC